MLVYLSVFHMLYSPITSTYIHLLTGKHIQAIGLGVCGDFIRNDDKQWVNRSMLNWWFGWFGQCMNFLAAQKNNPKVGHQEMMFRKHHQMFRSSKDNFRHLFGDVFFMLAKSNVINHSYPLMLHPLMVKFGTVYYCLPSIYILSINHIPPIFNTP